MAKGATATDFEALRVWVAEHLNAIEFEDADDDDDIQSVLSSLDHIVHGSLGCTDESDYTPEQWRVLMLCGESSRV